MLAKAASGALEVVPLVRAVNLARTLDQLKEAGFWLYGLDERGDVAIGDLDLAGRVCIVLGAEGEGLRRLTSEKCDRLVTIPTEGRAGRPQRLQCRRRRRLRVGAAAIIPYYQ